MSSTRAAGKQAIISTFRRFDKDGNGTIEKKELKEVLQALDKTIWTDEKVDILWWALDVNEDGSISLEEFARWITKPKTGFRGCKDHAEFNKLSIKDQTALSKQVTDLRKGAQLGSYFNRTEATPVVEGKSPFVTDEDLRSAFSAAQGVSCHGHGVLPRSPQRPGDECEVEKVGAQVVLDALPLGFSSQKGSKADDDVSPNQDNFSFTYFTNGYTLACAFDGHGRDGHVISARTVQTVPYFLARSTSYPADMKRALMEAFVNAQKDAVEHAHAHKWDIDLSGTTAVAAIWKDNKVWIANSGDARCVVGSVTRKELIFETQDHKPQDPAESSRIEMAGGEVRPTKFPDGWVSYRIFAKGTEVPGLCMARSLGDQIGKQIGVIAVPEVTDLVLDPTDQPFLVLGSDGIWEFLSSDFVVKACAKSLASKGIPKTLERLHREARRRWSREEGEYCDDITSVLVQL